MIPLPFNVVTTVESSARAISRISAAAPADTAPPPARMIGRRARQDRGGLRRRTGGAFVRHANRFRGGQDVARGSFHQVLGEEQGGRAGPARGHRRERTGQERGDVGHVAHRPAPFRDRAEDPLQVDLVIRAALLVHPVGVHLAGQEQEGTESAQASATPVRALVAPGPAVVQTTPGRPVTRE